MSAREAAGDADFVTDDDIDARSRVRHPSEGSRLLGAFIAGLDRAYQARKARLDWEKEPPPRRWLAGELRITTSMLSMLESGARIPSLHLAVRIHAVCKFEPRAWTIVRTSQRVNEESAMVSEVAAALDRRSA